MPRASKRASDTRAPATDTSAPAYTNEPAYKAAVERCKAASAEITRQQWVHGDEADAVTQKWGEKSLEQFADDINYHGAPCTLGRCRDVCRAWPKNRARARFFSSAKILATHPHRWEIVERKPDISKAEAREIMSKWRAEQAGTATPAAEADQDDDLLAEAETENAEQPEDEDLIEPEEDTAPTPTSAKQAKAKGPKKTDTEEEATLKENRSWLNTIVDIARAAIAEAGVIEVTDERSCLHIAAHLSISC